MFDINTSCKDYMSVIVTHACNKNCPFCVDAHKGLKQYITMKNVVVAAKFAKNKGIKDILIVGGEPTLHIDIVEIVKVMKNYGLRVILTTNYSKPEIVKRLDGKVDCFNISFYGQEKLPKQNEWISDISISTLIHKQQLETKKKLDKFITKYIRHSHLRFSTLVIANEWCRKNQKVDYLDLLPAKRIALFDGEILGQIYRKTIIKRYDKILSDNVEQSLKFHTDGKISRSW